MGNFKPKSGQVDLYHWTNVCSNSSFYLYFSQSGKRLFDYHPVENLLLPCSFIPDQVSQGKTPTHKITKEDSRQSHRAVYQCSRLYIKIRLVNPSLLPSTHFQLPGEKTLGRATELFISALRLYYINPSLLPSTHFQLPGEKTLSRATELFISAPASTTSIPPYFLQPTSSYPGRMAFSPSQVEGGLIGRWLLTVSTHPPSQVSHFPSNLSLVRVVFGSYTHAIA